MDSMVDNQPDDGFVEHDTEAIWFVPDVEDEHGVSLVFSEYEVDGERSAMKLRYRGEDGESELISRSEVASFTIDANYDDGIITVEFARSHETRKLNASSERTQKYDDKKLGVEVVMTFKKDGQQWKYTKEYVGGSQREYVESGELSCRPNVFRGFDTPREVLGV